MTSKEYLLDRFLLPEPYSTAQKAKRYDRIIPQAYGRNTFKDEDLPMIRRKRDAIGSDVAMFVWLREQGFDPGEPNRFIAESCYQATELSDRRVPIHGQREVMFVLWKSHTDWYVSNADMLVVLWPAKQGRQKTYGLFLEAKRACGARNVIPLIPAAPQHAPRTFFLARKVFGTTPAVIERYPDENPDHWYDSDSVQWWTRSEKLWLLYELCLARPHHLLHGCNKALRFRHFSGLQF